MKKYLILTALLCLAGVVVAGGFGSGWDTGNDMSGLGPVTADSVATKKVVVNTTTGDSVIVYTESDYPQIIMSVNGTRLTLKDTLTNRLRVKTLYIDSLAFIGASTKIYYNGTIVGYHDGAWGCNGVRISGANGLYEASNNNLPIKTTSGNTWPLMYGTAAMGYRASLGYTDTTKGVVIDSMGLRTKSAGGVGVADTLKATKGLMVGTTTMFTDIKMVGDTLKLYFNGDSAKFKRL